MKGIPFMNRALLSLSLLASLIALAPRARADDEASQLVGLVDKISPAIATVRVVLKTEFKFGGQGQDNESKLTLQGVVVDPTGLIIVSNSPFNTSRMSEMFGGGASSEGFGMKMTPTSFKVVFGREEKEYDAFLAATDTKIDLAFIKVEGLSDRKLPFVDFSASETPSLGQKVVGVSRLGKGYDYAPYFESARVSGEINKPRKAWMVDGGLGELGLPVFTPTGEVVGVLSTVPSGVKEEDSDDSMGFSMMMRLFGGGGGGMGAFILPGPTVKAVIEQASRRAVEVAAERAKKKAAAPAPAPAAAAPKKPGVEKKP
jgi:hypothetical protein